MSAPSHLPIATLRGRLALLCLVATFVACRAAPSADTDTTDRGGGDVVFALEAEPEILNVHLPAGNNTLPLLVNAPVLLGAFRVNPDFEYEPVLVEDATVAERPFTVTYRIRDEAVWDDGTPVSGDDFAFTWRTYTDPDNEMTTRVGYQLITEAEVIDPKTVSFTFRKPFAAWRELFFQVLPEHVLAETNFNRVWDEELTASNGPFAFESWDQGNQLTLVRNDRYWGKSPALDRIVFRFIAAGNSAAQALRAGEADVIDPRPTATIVEQLGNMAGVVSDVDTGPAWEHLAFNLNHPPLDQPAVRRAIAHGIDRGMITREVLQPVHPDLAPLDSVVYVSNQPQYRPTWADELAYDPQESLRLLTAAGCGRGDDGIFSCDGQRLSFRYATLSGDLRRQEFFEIIHAQLRDVGVELRAAFADAPVLFGDRLPGGDYEIAEWAWIGGPDPFGGNDIWRCDGELNFTGYCNRDVDDLLERSDSVVDPDTRAELFHDADALIAADVPVIPLFQTPTLLARRQGLEGVEANATSAGSTWNTEDWEWSE